jgi:5-methylcytosine-specific restriction endonuclease McrA
MTDRKRLVKKLDKVFGDWIKKRDGHKCVQCGTTSSITCGHLFSRANYSTRWDEENCYAQCMSENLRHEYEFEPFRRVVEARLGKEKYDALWLRHSTVKKFKNWELEELINKYS